MAGNVRFESCSASPEEYACPGGYKNVQRGSYTTVGFDRSGNFRKDGDSRAFGSSNSSRGSATSAGDLPPLSECLTLDPISMGDQKYTRSSELRRVLGISSGSTVEDNSFGVAKVKSPHPVAIEDLKRIRADVRDGSIEARGRTKMLDDSEHKLDKYCEALNSKKQQRSDMHTNDRSGGSNFMKIGNRVQRNLLAQRLEERPKNAGLNKRVRSSVAEIRAEGRTNSSLRQPMLMGKDRDMVKDVGEGCDIVEEKIRRLPVGGETWDRKMKRKRSIGAVSSRPIDGDTGPKRAMHHKFKNGSALHSADVQDLRSGSSNGSGGINKDGTTLPVFTNARAIPKNESDRVSLVRKERTIVKGNNKLSACEDDYTVTQNPLTKGNAPRMPRSSPVMAGNSSPNLPCTSGANEVCDHPPSINKFLSVSGSNNRKRPLPTGSSSPAMAQWVGQRPQKSSRSRRANVVSPVSSHDEVQISSESCDLGARVTSIGTNGLLPARNGIKNFKVKHEHVSSPARFSESEESGASENLGSRLKDKGSRSFEVDERGVNSTESGVPSVLFIKKNKLPKKEEIGDGVHKQGRSVRGASVSRASISPMREKLDTPTSTKPPRSTRPASEKNGSKSGRPPLKKLSDRKALTRLGHTSIGGSSDVAGESDDDREELLGAANYARDASNVACSSQFWKEMDPYFALVSSADESCLKQQLKSARENHESLFQVLCNGNSVLALDSEEKERSFEEENALNRPSKSGNLDNLVQDIVTSVKFDVGRTRKVAPFYQRVLSALIVEDETEEFEENNGERDRTAQDSSHSLIDTCLPVDVVHTNGVRTESRSVSLLGLQTKKPCTVNRVCCNGRSDFTRGRRISNKLSTEDLFQGDHEFLHSDGAMFPLSSENGVDGPLTEYTNACGSFSIDCSYDQMCPDDRLLLELQSIGLYPEKVPDLADGEDETIDQDIVELQKKLHELVGKKKVHMEKIIKAIDESRAMEERRLEQVAMDRLVELSYQKQLATRGSSASKCGVSKVSKQVATAFMKRTLSRCRIFEDTGKSCFTEPVLRDVIFAAPPSSNTAGSMRVSAMSINLPPESEKFHPELGISGSFLSSAEQHDLHNNKTHSSSSDVFGKLDCPPDQDFAKTGPIFNRGKKKEVLLDDVGGTGSSRAIVTLGNTQVGGVKGKRSERERDKDKSGRSSVAKAGRMSMSNFKAERKTKTKPKQKVAQVPASGNGFVNKFKETTNLEYPTGACGEVVANGGSGKGGTGLRSHGDVPQDSSKEIKEPLHTTNLKLNELDSIELHVGDDFGGPQDLSTLLNFDDDSLQDHYSAGLDIPMDDLSEVNLLL